MPVGQLAGGGESKYGPAARHGRAWEPDYDDPVFLEKLDHFLAALAERYDGSPEVPFIDVGSFGVWGEDHTFWSTKKPCSADTVHRHAPNRPAPAG